MLSAASASASCGDAVLEPLEDCDLGALNGTAEVCCTASCMFRAGGEICRASAADCDVADTCTGWGEACPDDGFVAGPAECKATLTFPAPSFGAPLPVEFSDPLESNVGLVERKSHGTFNMQRGRVKLPSYRNFLPDETTPASAWVALLVTNGGEGSSVEIFWKGKGFSGRYQAAPGQQAIVFIPQALGEKPVRVILKAPVPATGTVDFVTLSPNTLHFAVTETPRAVLLNGNFQKFMNVIYIISNDGSAPLRRFNCLYSLTYGPSCPNTETLAPGETNGPDGQESLMNPGSSSWMGTDSGYSTDAGVFFSEKAGMNWVVRP